MALTKRKILALILIVVGTGMFVFDVFISFEIYQSFGHLGDAVADRFPQ
jgi:hypothetical protein